MSLTPGQSLAHYRIERHLGQGGMGIVFLATDTKLGRKVALKVLPRDVAADPERLERFTREAKTLAVLDHPGIVTVYSVDEADGVKFLTTELIDGRTLAELIPQAGLPFDEICAITSELTAALAAAHDKGIIHRDL
ncbi:MAG: serine/threonine-protein kinase, partial [Planctomycetota bacterium]